MMMMMFIPRGWNLFFFWFWNCRFPLRGPRKSPSNFPVMLKFAKTTREKIAGRTSIPPHGSHPFIVCLSVMKKSNPPSLSEKIKSPFSNQISF